MVSGNKRSRCKSACTSCKSRRRRCDQRKPQCGSCFKYHLECLPQSQKPTESQMSQLSEVTGSSAAQSEIELPMHSQDNIVGVEDTAAIQSYPYTSPMLFTNSTSPVSATYPDKHGHDNLKPADVPTETTSGASATLVMGFVTEVDKVRDGLAQITHRSQLTIPMVDYDNNMGVEEISSGFAPVTYQSGVAEKCVALKELHGFPSSQKVDHSLAEHDQHVLPHPEVHFDIGAVLDMEGIESEEHQQPLRPGISFTTQATTGLVENAQGIASDALLQLPRTQKELMIQGEPFYDSDPELVGDRARCSAACTNYRSDAYSEAVDVDTIRQFYSILGYDDVVDSNAHENGRGGCYGEDSFVASPFTCSYGYNVHIGDKVMIGKNCTILDDYQVVVESRTTIGPNVNIYTSMLRTKAAETTGHRRKSHGRAVFIDQDCEIGGSVTILPGVYIGRGSVVQHGSVVDLTVPPGALVAGNPARLVKWLRE